MSWIVRCGFLAAALVGVGCGSSEGATLAPDASVPLGPGIDGGAPDVSDGGRNDASEDSGADAGVDSGIDSGADAGTLTGTGAACTGDTDPACNPGALQMCRNGFCVAERCAANKPGDDPEAHCRDVLHGECVHDTSSIQMLDTIVCEVRR